MMIKDKIKRVVLAAFSKQMKLYKLDMYEGHIEFNEAIDNDGVAMDCEWNSEYNVFYINVYIDVVQDLSTAAIRKIVRHECIHALAGPYEAMWKRVIKGLKLSGEQRDLIAQIRAHASEMFVLNMEDLLK